MISNRPALKALRDTNFADNNTGQISPLKLREFLDNFLDSTLIAGSTNQITSTTTTDVFTLTIGTNPGTAYSAIAQSSTGIFFDLRNAADTEEVAFEVNFATGGLYIDSRASPVGIKYSASGYETTDLSLVSRGYIHRTLFDDYADAGNGTTVETDIFSHTLTAGKLIANGDKIAAEYSGTFVGSATATRQVKFKFGGTTLLDTGALAAVAADIWRIEVSIIRVSSSVIRYSVSFVYSTLSTGVPLATFLYVGELTGLTLGNTQVIKLTGTAAGVGAATNDIVGKFATITFAPHA